jgi:hypothetical protein
LHARLVVEHAEAMDGTALIDELGLCGQVRVDVAVVNGALSGFELKSAHDTLRRLPDQVDVYSQVLDYATLVVAEKHADRAREMIPSWWGCIVAAWETNHAVLTPVVEPEMNTAVDAWMLAQLLWRDEALAELSRRGLDRGVRTKPRIALWERLAAELPLDDLRDVVRETLKSRRGWRPDR